MNTTNEQIGFPSSCSFGKRVFSLCLQEAFLLASPAVLPWAESGPEDQRDHSEGCDHTRKRDVGDGRIGEARQHTDADYRQRVADETTNKIARYHGGALIRGCDLVHHLQTARYPRPVDTATTTVAGMASWGRFIARGPGMKLTCRDDAGEASTRTWMAPESTIICSESAQRVRQSKRRKRTPIEHAAQPRRRIADRAIEAPLPHGPSMILSCYRVGASS